MNSDPEILTATVEGQFGEEHKITLVRQSDGHYEEAPAAQETLTATVEGMLGEEHKITLVRQPDGQYREVTDPAHPDAL